MQEGTSGSRLVQLRRKHIGKVDPLLVRIKVKDPFSDAEVDLLRCGTAGPQ